MESSTPVAEKVLLLLEGAPLFFIVFVLVWALIVMSPEVSFNAQGWFQKMKGSPMKPG